MVRKSMSCDGVSTPSTVTLMPSALCELRDRAHNRHVVGVGLHVADEGPVDLEAIDGQLLEVGQGPEPGAEIIERDLDGEVVKLLQRHGDAASATAKEDLLGDLDAQALRLNARLPQLIVYELCERP